MRVDICRLVSTGVAAMPLGDSKWPGTFGGQSVLQYGLHDK